MKLQIDVPDWEIDEVIREVIAEKVETRLELFKSEDVAKEISRKVIMYLGCGTSQVEDCGVIAQVLDKRVGEVIQNISDEFLKNALLGRLVEKMR